MVTDGKILARYPKGTVFFPLTKKIPVVSDGNAYVTDNGDYYIKGWKVYSKQKNVLSKIVKK